MEFRTSMNPIASDWKIDHQMGITCIGSCFAENIGNQLQNLKFPVNINPFGVIFNPSSIEKSLQRLLDNEQFCESDLFHANGLWNSFMHHSQFSHPEKGECLNQLNRRLHSSHHDLWNARVLIITFGTAWVYKTVSNGQIVANCHKLPANNFNRELLTVDEIVNNYAKLMEQVRKYNKALKIIFTVSPVRHLKDTAQGNQLSKAILLLAIHELCEKGYGEYFPAYELMLDDLRDYRFYGPDMVHPSEQAIDYIFAYFSETFFSEETILLNKEIKAINLAMTHKIMFPGLESAKLFMETIREKINRLNQKAPWLSFELEIKELQHKILVKS